MSLLAGILWSAGALAAAGCLFLAFSMVMTGCDLRDRANSIPYWSCMTVLVLTIAAVLAAIWRRVAGG